MTTDPYRLVMVSMVQQAFKDIEAYFFGGSKEAVLEGKKAIEWIDKMNGTFELAATASNMDVDTFQEVCKGKIEEIRNGKYRLEWIDLKAEHILSKKVKEFDEKIEKMVKEEVKNQLEAKKPKKKGKK